MTTFERAIRRGRWLVSRRRLMIPAVVACSVAAVLLSTPFRIIHHNIWLTLLCIAVAALGLLMRAWASVPSAAGPKGGPVTLPDAIAAGGVFSVVRYPLYTSNLLLIASVVLYTGIFWYMLAACAVCGLSAMCILLAHEHSLQARYGEVFTHWCQTTRAMAPALLNWQPWNVRVDPVRLVAMQLPAAAAVCACFLLLDVLKGWAVDFSFSVQPILAATAAALLFMSLATRSMRK